MHKKHFGFLILCNSLVAFSLKPFVLNIKLFRNLNSYRVNRLNMISELDKSQFEKEIELVSLKIPSKLCS